MNYETKDYVVRVERHNEDNHLYYAVINKETGVSEYDDNILPRTLDAVKNLQKLHDEAIENFNTPDEPTMSVVKTIGNESTH